MISVLNPSQKLYKDLRHQLKQTAFFDRDPAHYWRIVLTYGLLHIFSYIGILCMGDTWLRWVALIGLSISNLQFYYLSHDAGHYAIAPGKKINHLLGHIGDTFMGGGSFFFWQEKHNQHHQFCNDEEHDPDVNALFIKFYADDPLSRPAWIRWIVRHQAFLIWFLALFHNYDFQRLSWLYVLKHPKKCRAEMILIPLHFVVYLLVPTMVLGFPTTLINYVFVASLTGLILAQVFAINHIGMPTVPGNHSLSFLEQQVETSRNVRVPWFLDEYFGGLNYQIEHHLFPWVPISRYREGSPIVKAFCDRHQIKYVEEDFWTAMGGVERHLARMGATEARSRPIRPHDPLS